MDFFGFRGQFAFQAPEAVKLVAGGRVRTQTTGCKENSEKGTMYWSFPSLLAVAGLALALAPGASGEASFWPTAFHHATPPRSFGGGEGQFGGGGDGGPSQMSRLPARESRAASPIERMKSSMELRKSTLRPPQVGTQAGTSSLTVEHQSTALPLACSVLSPLLLFLAGPTTRHRRGGVLEGLGAWCFRNGFVPHAQRKHAGAQSTPEGFERVMLLRRAVQAELDVLALTISIFPIVSPDCQRGRCHAFFLDPRR